MKNLPYTICIDAREEPGYYSFYSPDLYGFSGVGTSIDDCLKKAEWGVRKHLEIMKERRLPLPPANVKAEIVINGLSIENRR